MSKTADGYGKSTDLTVQKCERLFASIGLRNEHAGLRVLGKHDNDLCLSSEYGSE